MPSQPAMSNHPAGNGETPTITLEEVKSLGTDLLSSREHINNLPLLLRLISPASPPQHLLESLLSLHSFFLTILPDIPSRSRTKRSAAARVDTEKDPETVYHEWLRGRFDDFLDSLVSVAASPLPEDAILDVVLDAIMEFVKKGKGGKFESAIYHRFMHGLVYATANSDSLLNLLAGKFFKYADVRYYTYVSLTKVSIKCEMAGMADERNSTSLDDNTCNKFILKAGLKASIHSICTILSRVSSSEGCDQEAIYEIWNESGLLLKGGDKGVDITPLDVESKEPDKLQGKVAKKMKVKLTSAWRSFLKLHLPMDVYKEALGSLHELVIPKVSNPVFLCDFLTRSYDIGGVISVMALSGLYILITQHGIEYPNYYNKLYALLTPTVFMAKYRSRFFQLLDSSLKSGYVPAYLAAAFAKKLSRLSLIVSPSSALVIIAIIHNLLRRHPSINFLVHQISGSEDEMVDSGEANRSPAVAEERKCGQVASAKLNGTDPFNMEECDPVKSDAMRSSLWEIDTLRHHYCPAVSRFVASLENDLTIRNKTSEVAVSDFASGSYATIFGSEIRRRIKQVPIAFYQATPTALFSESDFPGWSFGEKNCSKEVVDADMEKANVEIVEHQQLKRQRIDCS